MSCGFRLTNDGITAKRLTDRGNALVALLSVHRDAERPLMLFDDITEDSLHERRHLRASAREKYVSEWRAKRRASPSRLHNEVLPLGLDSDR